MPAGEKLLSRALTLAGGIRFGEFEKTPGRYGYRMKTPRSGSGRFTWPMGKDERAESSARLVHRQNTRRPHEKLSL